MNENIMSIMLIAMSSVSVFMLWKQYRCPISEMEDRERKFFLLALSSTILALLFTIGYFYTTYVH